LLTVHRKHLFSHNRQGQRIEVDFSNPYGKRSETPFRFCCAIALAQKLNGESADPTVWQGADDDFLVALVEHLDWKNREGAHIPNSTLRSYWTQYKGGTDPENWRAPISVTEVPRGEILESAGCRPISAAGWSFVHRTTY